MNVFGGCGSQFVGIIMIRVVQKYINFARQNFLSDFLKMTLDYQEEIAYISSRIRQLRKERHLTVQELAYRCDMERSNMSRIEAGRTNLTVKTMCIICNALCVSLRDLIR